ncbi:MAG: hypothetical protein J6K14_06895 [Clostridia bacterium]|nr:hypothetical protein [Clostridia bacterium]
MVKLTNFADNTTNTATERQVSSFFAFAAICRQRAFRWGNEKRIGKSAKISCRFFLCYVDLYKLKIIFNSSCKIKMYVV